LPRAKPLLGDVSVQCDFVAWDMPAAIAIITLLAIFAAVKIALLVYFVIFRAEPVFRISQVIFGVLVMLGGIMADLTPLTMLGKPSTTRCHLLPTWMLLAVTLLYGPLLLKTWKVWKVFDNPKLKTLRLSNGRLLAYLAVGLLLEVLVAAIFGFVQPLKAKEYDFSFSGGYGSLRRTKCSEEDTFFHAVAYAIVAIPLCGGLFLAFKTRKVSGDYTDNKAILGSMYTLVIAAVVLIPVTRITGDLTLVNFVMVSIGVLFVSTVTVSVYAVPKILYHRGILHVPSHSQMASQMGTVKNFNTATESGPASYRIDNMASEELAELRQELSDMRAAYQEQKEEKLELQGQLEQLNAGDGQRVRPFP
jgi:hypothetical protein